jgi:hypothetical protein
MRARALGFFALPGIAIVGLDLALRGHVIAALASPARAAYAMSAMLSVILWGALVLAGAQREGPERWLARALLVVSAGSVMGAQLYFFDRYHAFMSSRAVLVGTSMLPSVGQQLWSDRLAFGRALFPPLVIAAAFLLVSPRAFPTTRTHALAALDVALGSLLFLIFVGLPPRAADNGATPDVLYFASIGKLAYAHAAHDPDVLRVHPGARTPRHVAPLVAKPTLPRNILLIVDESVRASDVCSSYDTSCSLTPFTNVAAPNRFMLRQMRALDSTTAASLAVLWAGLPVSASRDDFHSAPLLWEFAHAAGFDTAYFTSQNPFFANAGLWLEGLPLSHRVTATELDPDPSYELGADDGALIDAVVATLPMWRAPFAAVVHLSNTHFPYKVDPSDAPFVPYGDAMGDDASLVTNRYRNAVHAQDKHVARLVRALRASQHGERTVVVFISDHGEQLRERGAIGHTYGVYDEELRVAAWIDAPNGTLSPAEAHALAALADTPLTMLDVMPTLLDLAGVWDAREITTMRAKMPGESLLRGGTPPAHAVLLSNCTEIFACAFSNWGAMRGTMKLVGDGNDHAWHCFDVKNDPGETHDLGADACGDLRDLAENAGRGAPWSARAVPAR